MKKNKIALLIICISVIFSGCRHKPAVYSSYNDYPEYKGGDLGASYTSEKTLFRMWSPAAEEVILNIYEDGVEGAAIATYDMRYDKDGTWTYTIKDDMKGKFYTFQVKQDGVFLAPTPGIWAKAVGCNGDRAAIINLEETNPAGWDTDSRPAMDRFTDAIIYEVHMRDFTISPTSGSSYPGKFLGLCEQGTTNSDSLKTGLDHLKELGITHVQILPIYDYGSIDESRLGDNKYNWGYDPKNYNTPEGGYSTDPYNPAQRILELKTMIQTLHQAGIRVIMDVVYNHTFVADNSVLNLQVPGYFYRQDKDGGWSNGSGCGNETASDRQMMRRYMVESVKYWINEYHIDGFRFDLMGIHDIETMNAIRAAVDEIDPTITIHGEGWAGGDCAISENLRAVKANARQFDPIAVFSDNIRDGIRGNWTRGDEGGFISGTPGYEETIKFGVVGATSHPQIDLTQVIHGGAAYAATPAQTINYASCHDDPSLVDKIKAIRPEATTEEIIRMNLLAQTIVFTAQGVPFIYAGEEILRDKKGVHNSYQSPDSVNEINWHNKTLYPQVFEYYRGLIAMRNTHPAFRMSSAEMVAGSIHFDEQTDASGNKTNNLVAYSIDGTASNDTWKKIYVIYNGSSITQEVALPEGKWNASCFDGRISLNEPLARFSTKIAVPATSAVVLFQK